MAQAVKTVSRTFPGCSCKPDGTYLKINRERDVFEVIKVVNFVSDGRFCVTPASQRWFQV